MKESDYLRPGERIDDLEVNGFRIIQNPSFFCFGMDAVLLANFVRTRRKDRIMDLGTGTGIIPLLLTAKGKCAACDGLELQEAVAEMAGRSVQLNFDMLEGKTETEKLKDVPGASSGGKTEKLKDVPEAVSEAASCGKEDHTSDPVKEALRNLRILQGDIRSVPQHFPKAVYDGVTCNPPYIKGTSGLHNDETAYTIARHEIAVSWEEIVQAAAHLVKPGGTFTLVHKPFRLPELMQTLQKYKLEPKRMQMVQPYADKEPNMVLLEAVQGGGPQLTVLPALVVYNPDGSYTRQVLDMYGKP